MSRFRDSFDDNEEERRTRRSHWQLHDDTRPVQPERIEFGRFALRTPNLERLFLGSPGRTRALFIGVATRGDVDMRSPIRIFPNLVDLVAQAVEAARTNRHGSLTVGEIPLTNGRILIWTRRVEGRPCIFFGREAADGERIGKPSVVDGDEQIDALERGLAWVNGANA